MHGASCLILPDAQAIFRLTFIFVMKEPIIGP